MYWYGAEEPRGAGGLKPPHVGEVVEAIGVGVAVFALGREILTSGDFSNTSSTANYMHQNTPPTQTLRKCALGFSLKAHHPRLGFGDQTIWYRLSFGYNVNELRNAAILSLQDRSSSLVMSKFKTSWTGQPHSLPSAPVAEVMFQ